MRFAVILVLIFIQNVAFGGSSDSLEVVGYWLPEKMDYVIEIERVGDIYRGTIVWLANPLDNYDQPIRDYMNKDPELRSRPVMGLAVFDNFEFDKGTWDSGKIYDYASGQTYNGKMALDEDDSLRVSGYYGILFFLGKTKVWSRVKDKKMYNLD